MAGGSDAAQILGTWPLVVWVSHQVTFRLASLFLSHDLHLYRRQASNASSGIQSCTGSEGMGSSYRYVRHLPGVINMLPVPALADPDNNNRLQRSVSDALSRPQLCRAPSTPRAVYAPDTLPSITQMACNNNNNEQVYIMHTTFYFYIFFYYNAPYQRAVFRWSRIASSEAARFDDKFRASARGRCI